MRIAETNKAANRRLLHHGNLHRHNSRFVRLPSNGPTQHCHNFD